MVPAIKIGGLSAGFKDKNRKPILSLYEDSGYEYFFWILYQLSDNLSMTLRCYAHREDNKEGERCDQVNG
jgi:hypothetical protein